jgi:hypothetical protein
MPATGFGDGDYCYLDLEVGQPGTAITRDLYVLLEFGGSHWCYPSWRSLTEGVDRISIDLDPGLGLITIIPSFLMPTVSPAGPFQFHAALFLPGELSTEALTSNVASCDFSLN